MKVAVVTGASSGIGLSISKKLLENGYYVYGVGRTFTEELGENFKAIKLDLRKKEDIETLVRTVKEDGLDLLVNGAGVAYYGTHENLLPDQIIEMLSVNLGAPMILASMFLQKLKYSKGMIVNISSITAKQTNNTHGVCYGATKAALSSFGTSLYEEIKKYDVRVVNIHPDLTDTNLYRNADFTVSGEPEYTLFPEDVAEVVFQCISARPGMCITDVTMKPQKFKVVMKRKTKSEK